ncbi:MAG TPA: hypothetical protein VH724_07330 [Candidatus Angelobacter sp.]|jgi:hypothetical protein|nr:hypothetical protein [Candidatus Angelobacter sp.]
MPAANAKKKSANKKLADHKKSTAPGVAKAKTGKAAKPDFPAVFTALRQVLGPFQQELAVQTDKPGNFHTEIPSILHRGKPLYFAGIRTGKNYVSFHLLPVYYSPELIKGMSPALKKRMQGKACFNFTVVDQECFAELKLLSAAGLKIFKSEKFRTMIQKMQ